MKITRSLRLGFAGLALAVSTAATAAWAANSAYPGFGQHLASATPQGATVVSRAEFYVSRVYAANNSYTYSNQTGGGQIVIEDPESDGYFDVYARVVCGSFVGRVHRQVHGLTGAGAGDPNDAMNVLFGSGLPNAAQWYDGIVAQGSTTQGSKTVSVVRIANPMVDGGATGHNVVLAAKYSNGSDSGHVMIATEWREDTAPGAALPQGATRRWRVRVLDSTKTTHYDGANLWTDSREQAESGAGYDGTWGTADDNDDAGIGLGYIHVFSDNAGAIVAWTWTLADNQIYTQAARPMVAGEMIVQ